MYVPVLDSFTFRTYKIYNLKIDIDNIYSIDKYQIYHIRGSFSSLFIKAQTDIFVSDL